VAPDGGRWRERREAHTVNAQSTLTWRVYLEAMRAHMAADERLRERLLFYVGRDEREPAIPDPQDTDTWLALLRDCEAAARAHREALEAWRYARVRRAA
jgi:hypothetical protein